MQSELLCLLVQIIYLKKALDFLLPLSSSIMFWYSSESVPHDSLHLLHHTLGYDIQESTLKYSEHCVGVLVLPQPAFEGVEVPFLF
jgi:hypothetical protein